MPIRRAYAAPSRTQGWITALVIVGLLGGIAVEIATSQPPSSPPPVVIQPVDLSAIYDPDFMLMQPLEPPSVDVVTHRLERREGRVVATGLLAVGTRNVARPQVHIGFYALGEEIGAVLGHVACSRIDALPCPWGLVGTEPPGTLEIRIRASGQTDMGDLHPVLRLRLAFDDEFEATTVESNLPEFEAAEGRLILHEKTGEIEVSVSVPDATKLRSPKATLVGYAEGSKVELVLPLPSPVGLSRRVELPEHERAIVRWQLWIDGSIRDW